MGLASPQHSHTTNTQSSALRSLPHSETTLKQPHRNSVVMAASTTTGAAIAAPSKGLSFEESMNEVEKLLNENVRHRYYDRRDKTSQQIAALRQTQASALKLRTDSEAIAALPKSFEFTPLQDPMMLTATAAQDDDLDDENSDDEQVNDGVSDSKSNWEPSADKRGREVEERHDDQDSGVSTQVRLKYFGKAAKSAYYKTYQELHGKSHLFVERPSEFVTMPAPTQSLRSSTASGGSSLRTPSSPLRKPTMLSSIAPLHNTSVVASENDRLQGTDDLTRIPTSSFARRRQALQSPAVASLGQSGSGASIFSGIESSPSLHSPRVLFLSSCIAKSHPAISILIRKDNCRTYDFSHQSLGDKFIIQFAECLPDLPLVEAINVSDNRLSDNALNCLLLALENKPNLTKLDISENEIGSTSAKSLRNYIASSLCTIKTLVLDNADVDDQECMLFMISFEKNKSVEHLSLRSNRIGQVLSTKAKTKEPSAAARDANGPVPTGGESIGAMLNVNLNIATLDLSWNLLKFASAALIGSALQLNYNLRELNLSYNACSNHGAMVFGQTIRINTALEKLNLSYNSIGAKGAMVIASGLAANKGLRELILDGNAIGLESGRALMHASCTRVGGAICHLSLFECNLTASAAATRVKGRSSTDGADAKKATKEMTLFNPSDPTGTYALDLSDPYENMIAHELLRIATFKADYRFVKLEYAPSSGGSSSKTSATKIELSRRPKKAPAALSVDAQVLQNRSPVALLFAQIDKDCSGSVDLDELILALREYGLTISEERLSALVNEYDYDHSGSLQEDEFHDLFLRCGFAMVDTDHSGSLNTDEIENVLRFVGIQDVTPQRIKRMLAQYDLNGSGEIDEHEFLEFMKDEMIRTTQASDHSNTPGSSDARERTLDEAYEAIALREPSGVIWKIPTTGLLTVEFDKEHSQDASASGHNDGNDTHNGRRRSSAFAPSQNVSDAVVAKLVSSVQGMSRNSAEQADFLKAVLADSDLFFTASQAEQLLEKQGELKTTARKIAAVVRILPQMTTRREAISLVARLFDARTQWHERFALRRQLGNMYAVLLGSLTSKYSFDLTSPDDRAALKKLALIAQEEKLFSKNRSGRSDTSQHGNWENFRHATIDGKIVLLTSTYILNALLAPASSLTMKASAAGAVRGEGDAKQRVEFYYVSTTRPPRGTRTLSKRRFDQLVEAMAESVAPPPQHQQHRHSVVTDMLEKTRANARMRWEMIRNSIARASVSSVQAADSLLPRMFRVQGTLDSVQQKLVQLEMLVSDRWLHSEQAAELVAAFPNAIHARARAACVLFGRIVDVENFIKVSSTCLLVWCAPADGVRVGR